MHRQTAAPERPSGASASPRRYRAGLVSVLAAVALAAAAAWWLLAEPVQSRLVWRFDEVNNHGLEAADIVGLTAMAAAVRLASRGLSAWVRSGRGGDQPE